MSPFRSYLAMLRYHLHRPSRIWLIVGFLTLQMSFVNALLTWLPGSESSGIGVDLTIRSVFMNVLIGIVFVTSSMTTPNSSWAWILPNAEFLFLRPISRVLIFAALLTLCFFVLLLSPILNLILTFHHPDLLLSLYHRGSQSTQAWRNMAIYKQVFPSSSVSQSSQGVPLSLTIPWGYTWEALWSLWEIAILGLFLQAISLIPIPHASRRMVSIVVTFLMLAGFLFWFRFVSESNIEKLFFFFVQHAAPMAILTLPCFALVQWATWKRIQAIEVLA
jgi:hypothetical protein